MKQMVFPKTPLLAVIAFAAIAAFRYLGHDTTPGTAPTLLPGGIEAVTTPASWSAGDWITVDATVKRTLTDDNVGSRHQRFIVALAGGRTLLVAHNIDLAERVPVKTGDRLSLHGRYETNDRGGVLHWTHHDPDGSSPGGWIEFSGKRYR